MTRSRKELVSLSDTSWYHCVSRCVRKAFLCGVEKGSGGDYRHRRQWIVERMKFLSSIFAIDIACYAIMSNHYHLIVHIDKERAFSWSQDEVLLRWSKVSTVPLICARYISFRSEMSESELRRVGELVEDYRNRLYNLSWFMKFLNEYIAKRANQEDGVRGHFWEGRYKSQALLDERALLAAMVYVDLNPIRAGIATTPENSEFTSICDRIQTVKHVNELIAVNSGLDTEDNKCFLMPFDGTGSVSWAIPYVFEDYLELVDWTGRAVREDKRGFIDDRQPKILQRLGINGESFIEYAISFLKEFGHAVAVPEHLVDLCVKRNQRYLKGMRASRKLFEG
jgi:hypothetical protein